jgi:hypothetical protein
MCRDITFAAAVNSLVSFFFFLSIFFSGRRNYWRKCVSGSLFFFVCLLSPHSPLGIELQSLPNLFNFWGFFFLITKCQMKYYFLFISFFFLIISFQLQTALCICFGVVAMLMYDCKLTPTPIQISDPSQIPSPLVAFTSSFYLQYFHCKSSSYTQNSRSFDII